MKSNPNNWVIFRFAEGSARADATMKNIVGGKGANLGEMARIGVPVPPGFTLPTRVGLRWEKRRALVMPKVLSAYEWVRGLAPPGLVSVRSGAPVSMPGMMDTVLNVGIVEHFNEVSAALGKRAAYDCGRRFLHMYGTVVLGMEHAEFEAIMAAAREEAKVATDAELTAADLKVVYGKCFDLYEKHGHAVPATTAEALEACIEAVFKSWNSERAREYRRLNGISDAMGTAVNVQAMVFGNAPGVSGTGVLFTRNPSTGEPVITGEWLPNAQGEDVVAGIRTPEPLDSMAALPEWKALHAKLCEIAKGLEKHFAEMQDIEFTVDRGKLWILQTRTGKRSARASFRILRDLVAEGLMVRSAAMKKVTRPMLDAIATPSFGKVRDADAVGLAASPGCVIGVPVYSAAEAVARSKAGESVVLVTHETTPDDIAGMAASVGVVTKTGGFTSHAAVVARGMNLPCVVGVGDALKLTGAKYGGAKIGTKKVLGAGARIALDGATGRVWALSPDEEFEHVAASNDEAVRAVLDWYLEAAGVRPRVNEVTGPRAHVVFADAIAARDVDAITKALVKVNNMREAGEDLSELTLDFSTPLEVRPTERTFFGMLGVNEDLDVGFVDKWVADIMASGFKDADMLKGAIVVANSPRVLAEAKRLGMRLTRSVETVADLLEGGVIRVPADTIKRVFGGPSAFHKLRSILSERGIETEFAAPSMNPDYVIYSAVGGE